jgi:tetratricopeptide (TPR) repeat protein
VLYDRIFFFASSKEALRSRWPLYAGLAATWLELGWLMSTTPRGSSAGWSPNPGLVAPVTPWVYLLNQAVMIVHYLRLALWPSGMVLDYGIPRNLTLAQVAPQMAIVAMLGLLTIVALWRAPAAGFLGAWFFVTLAPSSSVLPIHTEVGAERRMYLASMAIVVFLVVAIHRWAGRAPSAPAAGSRPGKFLIGTTIAIVAALAATTFARTAEYASPLTMWRTVVDRWPNGRARWALATELKAAGRADEVLPVLREAVTDYPEAHLGIGEELFAQKQYVEAVDELDTFVRLRPLHVNVIDAHEFAGRALAAQGKVDEAIGRFRLILKMVPTYAAAHGRLADLYFQHQRFAEAAEEYPLFLAARRSEAGPWTNYAISLVETGRGDQAVKAFERAVALEPRSGHARRNLAKAYFAQRDLAGAEREAREALRIDARDTEARDILAVVLDDSRPGLPRAQSPR